MISRKTLHINRGSGRGGVYFAYVMKVYEMHAWQFFLYAVEKLHESKV